MKIIDYNEPIDTIKKNMPEYLTRYYKDEKILYFDIETTGFSSRSTTLYLIGALWYENDLIKIRQWFNDDGYCEAELISAFNEFAKEFTLLIHFNGLGFDLPYLKQKADMLNIDFTVDTHLYQLDIFKEIRGYKGIFGLENMKQVAIESFLEIDRKDTLNGGELINVYQRYVASPDSDKEKMLLLHNHDDLLGMPQITRILNYKAFFKELSPADLTIQKTALNENGDRLEIIFSFPDSLSLTKRISLSHNGYYINACDNSALLEIPVTRDTLKHYFDNYKDYYYLPAEDIAIHKSVARYVENDNKRKATKSTCYTRITDAFIPYYSNDNCESFQYNCKDKMKYQSLNSLLSADDNVISEYICNCLMQFV